MKKEPFLFIVLRVLPWYSFLIAFLKKSELGWGFVISQLLSPILLPLTVGFFILIPFWSLYFSRHIDPPRLKEQPIYAEIVVLTAVFLSIILYVLGIFMPPSLSFEVFALSLVFPFWKPSLDLFLSAIGY